MEDFGIEGLVAFRGDELVVTKADGMPFPALQTALEKFYNSDKAPSYPVRPGYRMTYLVMRTSPQSRKFEYGKPMCTVTFESNGGVDPFFHVMVDAGMSHCRVVPIYVPVGADKVDLEVTVHASFSGRPLPALKGADVEFRGTTFKMLEYRRYRPSDGNVFPMDASTNRTTAIVGYDKAFTEYPSVMEMRRNFYVQGTWEYVDKDGVLTSKPLANVDWKAGGIETKPPKTMLVSHDTEKKTMTFCSNLAPSQIPGFTFTLTKQIPAKLVGIQLIR
jgi:hypothetical protein